MELYHMADVIPLLGIPEPPYGRSSYYINCPCCDTDPRKKHMNINLAKDVFRCPRCGASGGIFDLYSLHTGTPREKVRQILVEKLGNPETRPKRRQEAPIVHECPLTDVDTRHVTYMALLSKLTLAPDHLENLLARGFTEAEISRLGYKTTPIVGSGAIARQMQGDGLYLAGVPGFYRNESGAWTFVHEQRGILIPVRNVHGQIQGLQIRRDQVSRRKFRWVSSAEKPDGCRAEGWTHLAGSPTARIILTEGPMKADVIHTLTGDTVLAVPGVNALTQLEKALEVLRAQGVEERSRLPLTWIWRPTSTSKTDTTASPRCWRRWASITEPTSGTPSTRGSTTTSGKAASTATAPNRESFPTRRATMFSRKSTFFFTFGIEGHPFRGGWTEVEAPDINAAIALFRALHPDKTTGILNCSSVYTEEQFTKTAMFRNSGGNLGARCHERITVTRVIND